MKNRFKMSRTGEMGVQYRRFRGYKGSPGRTREKEEGLLCARRDGLSGR
jgi:hypothetical protein